MYAVSIGPDRMPQKIICTSDATRSSSSTPRAHKRFLFGFGLLINRSRAFDCDAAVVNRRWIIRSHIEPGDADAADDDDGAERMCAQ